MLSPRRHPLLFLLPLAAIAATVMALQGMNHDQMIFYQAGLRSWARQIPYRDYTVPQGPVAGLVFALFLWIVPVTGGFAFLAASAALNMAATFLVWRFVWRASGDRTAATVGALLTALWFLTVFGSFYNDHLAYVLVLAAAASAFEARWWIAGLLFALAYHTKQTVALTGLAAFAVCDLVTYRRAHAGGWRRLLLAMVATHFVVFALIALVGGGGAYWRSVVRAPLQFAARSPGKSPWRIVTFLVTPWNINPWRMVYEHGVGRLAFYPLVLAIYAAAAALCRRKLKRDTAFGLGFLVLSTLWCAAWLGRFQGQLVFGAGGAVALTALAWRWRWRFVVAGFVPLALLNVAVGGPWVPAGQRATAYDTTDLYPIHIESNAITRPNADVIAYLRDRPGAIAMSGGDTYYIAAALRRAPWNPTVYFEFPLTVPLDPQLLAAWESAFINALEKHNVRYVLADISWSEKDYVQHAKAYVVAHYHPVFRSPPLVVLERN